MDPFASVYPNITNPSTFEDIDEHLFSFEFPISALEAQQLLQQIGWTYYTIWKEVDPLIGLAWSRGDVNRRLVAGTANHDQQCRACKTGLVLQKFYQQCSLLPVGLGIAGGATASRQYQWASGNELLQQINALSSYNHQPAPPALQAHGFQTILCIPLQKNAGVLEIGTTELVSENVGMLFQVLDFTNIFGTPLSHGGLTASPPSNIGRQYIHGKTNQLKQYTTAGYASNAMQIYRSRVTRQPSLITSYRSSSSPNSSSPSLEQMTNTTTMLSPSPAHPVLNSNEEMLTSPASCLHAAPMSMVTSFGQLDILNQTVQLDALYGSPVSIPSLSLEICDPPPPFDFDRDQRQLSDSPTFSYFSSGNVDAASPPLNVPFLTEYMPPQAVLRDQYDEGHPDQYDEGHPLVYESAVSKPFSSVGQNSGNIIDQVKDAYSAGELSTIPAQGRHIASEAAISTDYNFNVRAKGKQVVPNIMLGAGAAAEKSSSNWIMQIQGSTSIINPSGRLPHQDVSLNQMSHHDVDAGKDQPDQSGLIMRGFRPWRLMGLSRMRKPKQIRSSTNRCNVKQILRFHLPRIADMMTNAEAATSAQDTHFVLMSRRGLAPAPLQQHFVAGTAETDHKLIGATGAVDNKSAAALEQSAKQHKLAERNRRRKQGDCLAILRTLIPNVSKKDKVTTLERTIDYLKEMQSLVHDLEQQKNLLQNKDLENMMGGSQNINATPKRLVASLLRNASCEFHHSCGDQHVGPHFELDLSITLKGVEPNASLINIITALQQQTLQCIDIKMDFHQSSHNFFAKILAQYQDEENYTPTLAEIQDIKQWWTNHIDKISTVCTG